MKILNQKHNNLALLKNAFFEAKPFPYIVLDNFLDDKYYEELTKILSSKNRPSLGKKFKTDVEFNKAISLNSDLPVSVSDIVDELNKPYWVENLKGLTGIETLVATSNGNTLLANYHEMTQGGILGSHVDHSFEPELGLPHVLNIVLYLSHDWDSGFGGNTILFNKNGSKAIAKVDYKPNRAIIFLHTPYSFHGVDRIKGNGSIVRKSLYVDYYSESFDPFKNMTFDFPNKWFKHSTSFRLPNFLDYFKKENRHYLMTYFKYWLAK
jgi:hypothetical protein